MPGFGTRRLLARYYPLDVPGESRRHAGFVLTDISDIHATQVALRESRDKLDGALKTRQALINSLPAHIALLDSDAEIIDVNEQWRHFGEQNDFEGPDFGVGSNYLNICDSTTGECDEEATEIAERLREVLSGDRDMFALESPLPLAR